MGIFLIESFIGDFFEGVVRDVVFRALSYGGRSFVCETSLDRQQVVDVLREDVDESKGVWHGSKSERFFVGHVGVERVVIGTGKVWGPVLDGVVETNQEGGSTVKGHFRLGGGATFVFGLIVFSLFATMALIIVGLLHPGAICVWLSISVLLLLIGWVSISNHKDKLLGKMERRLKQRLVAAQK